MGIALGRSSLKTLYIIRILMEQTDEEHYLNATQIGEILEREYDLKLDRHTIYAEMKKLEDADLDIMKRDEASDNRCILERFICFLRYCLQGLKFIRDSLSDIHFDLLIG